MSKYKASDKRMKIFLGGALIVISFWLSTNAFIASQYVDRVENRYSKTNLYLSSRASKQATLAASINRQSKGLEYMVWRHERRNLSVRLSEILQQRINLDPFNGELWMQLNYFNKEAGVRYSDRAWAIERAAKLLKWNFDKRSLISHYCIIEYDDFHKVSPGLCASLISNLPKDWPDHQKAKKANVRLSDLQAALTLAQLKSVSGDKE